MLERKDGTEGSSSGAWQLSILLSQGLGSTVNVHACSCFKLTCNSPVASYLPGCRPARKHSGEFKTAEKASPVDSRPSEVDACACLGPGTLGSPALLIVGPSSSAALFSGAHF